MVDTTIIVRTPEGWNLEVTYGEGVILGRSLVPWFPIKRLYRHFRQCRACGYCSNRAVAQLVPVGRHWKIKKRVCPQCWEAGIVMRTLGYH